MKQAYHVTKSDNAFESQAGSPQALTASCVKRELRRTARSSSPVLVSSSIRRSSAAEGFQRCGRDTTHTLEGSPAAPAASPPNAP